MTLLERYLRAVRFFLPRKHQDDIVRELYENIASDLEARADALGRELHEAEVADILRRHGHPMVVAARYGSRQQLIGPALFPIYVLALKFGLAAAFAVTLVLALIGMAMRGASVTHVLDVLLAYPGRALVVFAWTTLVFAVLDVAGSRSHFNADWDPRRIPDWMAGSSRRGRLNAAFEVVFGLTALVWLLMIPNSPWLALGPLAAVVEFAPSWRTWYVPLALVATATLALDVARWVRPALEPTLVRARLSVNALQVLVVAMLLAAGEWVVLRPSTAGAATAPAHVPDAAALVHGVNVAFGIGLVSVLVITLIEMGRQFYRLRTGGASITGPAADHPGR